MEDYLSYELASEPASLFQDGAMRKTDKSVVRRLLKSQTPEEEEVSASCVHVIDSGFLLQSVIWPQSCTYEVVCETYAHSTVTNYGAGSTVVFDGYRQQSTKAAEQLRRSMRVSSSDIVFDKGMATTTTQAAFLAN